MSARTPCPSVRSGPGPARWRGRHYPPRVRIPSKDNPTDAELRNILESARTIAVVGASDDAEKAANQIPRLMQRVGYHVVPVTRNAAQVLGERTVPSLDAVTTGVDIVDVFRPPVEGAAIAQAAVRLGAKVLWFQPGTSSPDAVTFARQSGLVVVEDLCIGATWKRLEIPART